MQATHSQEIKTKGFEDYFQDKLEKKLSEFLSSEEMKEAIILDIQYSFFRKSDAPFSSVYSAFVIYK